ncbi:MAG: hypothetical protein K8I30_11945, partial [Anaerolineae bacterium]|nr:hypothetical protein [Anaerolineae bacterium]
AHGGTIEVQSVIGKGTTFTVMLRVFEPKAPIEVPAVADESYMSYLSLPRFVRRRRTPETSSEK